MKKTIVFTSALFVFICAVFVFRSVILRRVIEFSLLRGLGCNAVVSQAGMNPDLSIWLRGLSVKDEGKIDLYANSADIRLGFANIRKKGLRIDFYLRDISISRLRWGLIDGILSAVSLADTGTLTFSSGEGTLYNKSGRFVAGSFSADGELVRIKANGMMDKGFMDYGMALSFSRILISRIPETVSKVFFRQSGDWFEADIEISGSVSEPVINFRTELFTLSVR
jgi:hypothetical protein